MINYKASGQLVSSFELATNYHLVLVDLGNKFVVSKYYSGVKEWLQGHYFDKACDARAYFTSELVLLLPITSIHVHPELPSAVAKLNEFLTKIQSAA